MVLCKDKSSTTLFPKQKTSPSLLVEPRWRRARKQHVLVSHLTRGRPANHMLPRQRPKPDAGLLSFANLLVLPVEQSRRYWKQCTREQSDHISSMAPQRGQPQQRQTNRPWTKSRTRHFFWSDHWCDAVHTDAKILMQADKFRCMPNHPMKTRLEGLTKNRLKRSSFVHENRKLTRQFHNRLPKSTLFFYPQDKSKPWVMDTTDIKVHTTVPFLSDWDTQDDTVKQSLTLAMIAERYPQEVWIHVFTDGSAINAVTNRGAGTLVQFPGGQKATASRAVGRYCSKYRTETETIMQAAFIAQVSDHDCKQVVFLPVALSVL